MRIATMMKRILTMRYELFTLLIVPSMFSGLKLIMYDFRMTPARDLSNRRPPNASRVKSAACLFLSNIAFALSHLSVYDYFRVNSSHVVFPIHRLRFLLILRARRGV